MLKNKETCYVNVFGIKCEKKMKFSIVCKLCGEKRDMFNSVEEGKHSWRKTAQHQADAAKHIKGIL